MYPDDKTWWGSLQVDMGTAARLRIGPATILIGRLENEWHIATETTGEPDDVVLDIEVSADEPDLLTRANVRRFGVSGQTRKVTLSAHLADRPVVAASHKPVELPAGETLTVYVGSPVWIHAETVDPRRELFDMPLSRPADTWFGPSPRVGELCYTSRTHYRLRLEEMPYKPHRAITSVLVENQASTPLQLDSLKLPVPHLALYGTADGHLWTQDVTLSRDDEHELSPLRVRQGAPRHAEDAVRLAEPRQPIPDNFMVRAFSSLFSF
ncbi:MAG TPA: hypothetical protein VNM90_24895 [Haliangium sp.]|nr:hypothetical protein [Haliangium sp.]